MSNPIRILLAEDEPALGQIVKESLETRNFEVILCEDGTKAYENYIKHKPEVLVLDVMMPKKDGFTLAEEIRKSDKDTPIIFLTAKSQTKDVVNGFELGGNDYLKKPFSMEELIVRIKALLDRVQQRKSKEFIAIGGYKFNWATFGIVYHHIMVLRVKTHQYLVAGVYFIFIQNLQLGSRAANQHIIHIIAGVQGNVIATAAYINAHSGSSGLVVLPDYISKGIIAYRIRKVLKVRPAAIIGLYQCYGCTLLSNDGFDNV